MSVCETQKKKRTYKNKPITIKKMVIGTYMSIITLNVNGLNAPTKRHRLAEWIQEQDPYICCLQETHFRPRDTYRLKVRGWKNIFHANGNQKLYTQAKATRIQHHQTSSTTNAKGTSLSGKHKTRKGPRKTNT